MTLVVLSTLGSAPGPIRATMKAILLNGAADDDATAAVVASTVVEALAAGGEAVESFALARQRIAVCTGSFHCWTTSPGRCVFDDDNRRIAAAMANADLAIWITPIAFGGHASLFKRALDHLIQNLSPFFELVAGETHRLPRYARYPRLLIVGIQEQADPERARIFDTLAWRNAVNLCAPQAAAVVVDRRQPPAEVRAAVQAQLGRGELPFALDPLLWLQARQCVVDGDPPDAAVPTPELPAPRHVLLLVGSPRHGRSTSQALGSYLATSLAARGVTVRAAAVPAAHDSQLQQGELVAAVATADAVVLAAPVHFDSLPAPTTAVLERLAQWRRAQPAAAPQRWYALLNCGFPEVVHTTTAMAICRRFAREAGLVWGGGLGLGGGQGLVAGRELTSLGRRGRRIGVALDLAADAIAIGAPMPAAAREQLARVVVARWVYALWRRLDWRQRARAYGVQDRLGDRPYLAAP